MNLQHPTSNVIQELKENMADSIDRGVGGYDYEFTAPLPSEYECPICHLAFREPVQLEECGHRFCQSCLTEMRKRLVADHYFKSSRTVDLSVVSLCTCYLLISKILFTEASR